MGRVFLAGGKPWMSVPGWAEFEQPLLTADGILGGRGFAVAASSVTTGYEPWRAFSVNASAAYSSAINPSTKAVTYTIYNPEKMKVTGMTFTNVPSPLTSSSPRDFTVQGSDDNSAWTTLGTFRNTNNTNGAKWSIELAPTVGYRYYRLVITSANTSQAYMNIGAIQLTAVYKPGSANFEWVAFSNPVLTADGTLGGDSFAVSASSVAMSGYEAWRAFSSDASKAYSSGVNPSTTNVTYTMYNPIPLKVSRITFVNVPAAYASSSPKNFTVQGSNDNSAWTTLGTYRNTNNTNGAEWFVDISTDTAYKYYRIVMTSANTSQAYVNIGKIRLAATYESVI